MPGRAAAPPATATPAMSSRTTSGAGTSLPAEAGNAVLDGAVSVCQPVAATRRQLERIGRPVRQEWPVLEYAAIPAHPRLKLRLLSSNHAYAIARAHANPIQQSCPEVLHSERIICKHY